MCEQKKWMFFIKKSKIERSILLFVRVEIWSFKELRSLLKFNLKDSTVHFIRAEKPFDSFRIRRLTVLFSSKFISSEIGDFKDLEILWIVFRIGS